MSEAIIVAIITASGAVLGQLIITSASKKRSVVEESKREQRLNDRLETIEHKLDEHNGYAKKIGQIERSLIRIDTIVSMNRRSSNEKKHFKR